MAQPKQLMCYDAFVIVGSFAVIRYTNAHTASEQRHVINTRHSPREVAATL